MSDSRHARDEDDPFLLGRFVAAQKEDYARALDEICAGRKRSHWMWYIFPQFAGLGLSSIARLYAINSVSEAQAYLNHHVLGPRLVEICKAALAVEGRTAHDIFGLPDDLKLRSCATLFATIALPNSVFEQILAKYFRAERDERTLQLMGAKRDAK